MTFVAKKHMNELLTDSNDGISHGKSDETIRGKILVLVFHGQISTPRSNLQRSIFQRHAKLPLSIQEVKKSK